MAKDKISVVTVCYNSVDTIEKTIRSVVEQTYDNIEYIVIDGGSTDGTVDVIKKYADRIIYWVSEPDKGIYDAMNKGIAVATGEWIHFRNSGDFFLYRDSVKKFFAEPVDKEVAIVHGNCLYYDNEGWFEQTPPSLRVSYHKEIPILHPATFVRTELQKQMPFDLQYRSSADYDFFYKCCTQGIRFEYRPIAIVAFAQGGFSSNWERAYWEDCRLQGMTKKISGRVRSIIMFIWKKFINAIISIKRNTPFLRKVRLFRKKKVVNPCQPLPVPSDF